MFSCKLVAGTILLCLIVLVVAYTETATVRENAIEGWVRCREDIHRADVDTRWQSAQRTNCGSTKIPTTTMRDTNAFVQPTTFQDRGEDSSQGVEAQASKVVKKVNIIIL